MPYKTRHTILYIVKVVKEGSYSEVSFEVILFKCAVHFIISMKVFYFSL